MALSEDGYSKLKDEVFKKEMLEKYSDFIDDMDLFIAYMMEYPPQTVRVNTLKADLEIVVESLESQGFKLERLPWCNYGFKVEGEMPVSKTLEHTLGYIYLQDGASMIPPLALDLKPGLNVLDLCAAPGSKTTQIAQIMGNSGCIVANDVKISRIKALTSNIQRLGVVNTIITMVDGRRMPRRTSTRFDRVLVDAPCSGIGEARRNWAPLRQWAQRRVESYMRLQRMLVVAGFDLLKPGGIMVYSTCTLDPEENEFVIQHLIENRRDAVILGFNPNLRYEKGLTEWHGRSLHNDLSKTIRVYPHHNDTQGFYVAKIGREEA